MTMLTVLHTNDIHGHLTGWQGWEGELRGKMVGGLDRLATIIKEARIDHPAGVLLLDAGDLIGDTMLADLTKGRALLKVHGQLGYDALTIGNHEPDFGMEELAAGAAEANIPLLAANITKADSGELFTTPYLLQQTAGVKVGILGLAYPKTARTTAAKNLRGVAFHPPTPAARDYLQRLRAEGAEVVIVLSHLGLHGDQKLAEEVPGIDVIIGGHSHNRMSRPLMVGSTLIVQAGAHGADCGKLELDISERRIVAHRYRLYTLDHASVQADPSTAELIANLRAPHREALSEPAGEASDWLIRAQTLAGQEAGKRDEESPVDLRFADILREVTGADLALLPGVGYGVAIPPGPIAAEQLRQLLPHDGKAVSLSLTGSQVREILEQAIENVFSDDPAVKVGGMIQVSGLSFRYDQDAFWGQRIKQIDDDKGAWKDSARYRVVTNSLLAEGGHNYQTFQDGKDKQEHGPQYEMIKNWLKEHSPVGPPKGGRIARIA